MAYRWTQVGAGTMHKHPESKVTKTGALSTDPGKMGVITPHTQEGELSDLTRSHRKLAGKMEIQPLNLYSKGRAPKTSRQTDCSRRGLAHTEVFLQRLWKHWNVLLGNTEYSALDRATACSLE